MLKLLVTGAGRFAVAWVTGGVLRLLVRVLDRQAEAAASTEHVNDESCWCNPRMVGDLVVHQLEVSRPIAPEEFFAGARRCGVGVESTPGTAVTAEGRDASIVEAELAGFLHGADAANQLEWE